jgi:hypothetical protein
MTECLHIVFRSYLKSAKDLIRIRNERYLRPLTHLVNEIRFKEDEKSPYCNDTNGNKGISANLFTNEGLQPSIRDLDNLFDNSDTSSDETVRSHSKT